MNTNHPAKLITMKLLRFALFSATALILPSLALCDATRDTADTAPREHMRPPPTPEMQAYHKLVMAIYDADKNGVLDETERAVLRDDIVSGKMQPPPRPEHMHGHRGPPPEILEKYDTDKDGKLSESERAALEADIAAGKLPLPPHRRFHAGDADADCPPPVPPPQS